MIHEVVTYITCKHCGQRAFFEDFMGCFMHSTGDEDRDVALDAAHEAEEALTMRDRVQAALASNELPVSIPCNDRSPIRGEPMVTRKVFPPMTLEDDDAVMAHWNAMPNGGQDATYAEAMQSFLDSTASS